MVFLKCVKGFFFVVVLFDFEFALAQKLECTRHLCRIWVVTSYLVSGLLSAVHYLRDFCSRGTDDKQQSECEQDFYQTL